MRKYIYMLNVFCLAIAMGLAACSDDDDQPGGNTDNNDDDNNKVTLTNQFSYKDKILDIKSVLRFDEAANAVFYLSPTADVKDIKTMRAENNYLRVSLPADKLGQKNDFSTAGITVSYESALWQSGNQIKGSLEVKLTGSSLKLELQAESEQTIACSYEGGFIHQICENLFAVTLMGGEKTEAEILSAFHTPAQGETKAVTFALGSVKTETPHGLSAGKYTVMFAVPESHFDGKYHAYDAVEGYQFYLIDNESGKYVKEVTEGRLSVKAEDAMMYLRFEATLKDGSKLAGEYYGASQEVEELDILPATNTFTFNSGYGTQETDYSIKGVIYKKKSNGDQVFGFKKYEDQELDNYMLQLIITDEALIGKTKTDLAATSGWKINYVDGFQLEYVSPDDPDAQWKIRSKGYLSIVETGENKYRISIEAETIPASGWSKPAMLQLSWEGSVTVNE